MAFLRFTRDKRGYEHFSLVEATTNRRGKSRSRLLYWYRTPPNVRVGREPFDDEARRALEAHNPGVQFDWRKIVETPIPSAETERWRERRRAEKAEKAARRAAAGAPVDTAESDEIDDINESIDSDEGEDREMETSAAPPDVEADAETEAEAPAFPEARDEDRTEVVAEATGDVDRAAHAVTGQAHPAGRRRRRRRGRRGRSGHPSSTAPTSTESPVPSPTRGEVEAPVSEPEGD